jgi:hypothetical protein
LTLHIHNPLYTGEKMTVTSFDINPNNVPVAGINDSSAKKLCVLLVEAGNQVADELLDRLDEDIDSFNRKFGRKNPEKMVLKVSSSSGLFDDEEEEDPETETTDYTKDTGNISPLSRMNEFYISACGQLLFINKDQQKYEKIWMIAINDEEVFENWDEMVQKVKKFGGSQNVVMTPVYWNQKNMTMLGPFSSSSDQQLTELGFSEFMDWIDENI